MERSPWLVTGHVYIETPARREAASTVVFASSKDDAIKAAESLPTMYWENECERGRGHVSKRCFIADDVQPAPARTKVDGSLIPASPPLETASRSAIP